MLYLGPFRPPPCTPGAPTGPRPMVADATDTPPPIDALIERCLAGDESAWNAIVRANRRRVFNIAYKFVGRHSEAEDLTQDVFIKIFRSLHTFDRRANFQTWLFSVSRNLCIDHYRSLRKEREVMNHDIDADTLSPSSSSMSQYGLLEQRDRVTLLRLAMEGLTPMLKQAVVMRDLQELTYQDIADQLQVPEGTVKSRINRGRAELARRIARLQKEQASVAASTYDRRGEQGPSGPGTGAAE